MTEKKSNDSRRKLLKSIAAGSGAVVAGKSLPESWSKPVIDTVMLPAHAATTPTPCPECDDFYCYYFESEGIFMIFNVEGESIAALLQFDNESNTGGSTTANCGAFKITIPVGDTPELVVEGVVALDCSEVTGTLTISGQLNVPFTATTANCEN